MPPRSSRAGESVPGTLRRSPRFLDKSQASEEIPLIPKLERRRNRPSPSRLNLSPPDSVPAILPEEITVEDSRKKRNRNSSLKDSLRSSGRSSRFTSSVNGAETLTGLRRSTRFSGASNSNTLVGWDRSKGPITRRSSNLRTVEKKSDLPRTIVRSVEKRIDDASSLEDTSGSGVIVREDANEDGVDVVGNSSGKKRDAYSHHQTFQDATNYHEHPKGKSRKTKALSIQSELKKRVAKPTKSTGNEGLPCSSALNVKGNLLDLNRVELAQRSLKKLKTQVAEKVMSGTVAPLEVEMATGGKVTDTVISKKVSDNRKHISNDGELDITGGWTREQEILLQRAYFAANPTPHFWKKVARMVPGKSAQQCFDKIHSGHLTPPQTAACSRTKKASSSPLTSANKLLHSAESNINELRRCKKKTYLNRKAARHLLQKQYNAEKKTEADLFKVLEPEMVESIKGAQPETLISTPKGNKEISVSLQSWRERSSLTSEKYLSRLSNTHGQDLVSPPVLKPIRNKALHEKYIDQLHSREAKRNAKCLRAAKWIPGKEEIVAGHLSRMGTHKVAKTALVLDAKEMIDQFRKLQTSMIHLKADEDDSVDIDIDNDEDNEVEEGP